MIMEDIKIWIIEDDMMAIEQNKSHCETLCEELKLNPNICFLETVEKFKEEIKKKDTPDLMIVDLKLGESNDDRSGWETIREIIKGRIIPVIVYSAFSEETPEDTFENALIWRVTKGDESFIRVMKKFLKMTSEFKKVRREVTGQFEKLSLETVGKLLKVSGTEHIEELSEGLMVQLAITRLTSYLLNSPTNSEQSCPESIFIYPPFEKDYLLAGDFIQSIKDKTTWLVLSPSCDLVFSNARKAKVGRVLLLRCYNDYKDVPFLKETSESINEVTNRAKRNTIKILKCHSGIFGSDSILISFKDYQTFPYQEIIDGIRTGDWKILSSLATPYREDLQNLFIRDLSRIGTPETATSEEEQKLIKKFCSDRT